MQKNIRCQVTLFAMALAFGAASAPAGIFNLGTLPGGSTSRAYAVSSDGQVVVGDALTATGAHAFRWTPTGGMQDLQPGSLDSGARGVSADGSLVVGSWENVSILWNTSGVVGGAGFLPSGSFSQGIAVNADASAMAGYAERNDYGDIRAFRWTAGTGIQDLGVLSGTNQSRANAMSGSGMIVVGDSFNFGTTSGSRAFRWSPDLGMQSLGVMSGGTWSVGNAVSTDGAVVVGYGDTAHGTRAFRWTQTGGMQDLGTSLGAATSYAWATSADGTTIAGGNGIATLWTQGLGMVDLNAYLPTIGIDLAGWTLQTARGLSSDGRSVVGWGTYYGETRAFLVTGVPSPGTASILSLVGYLTSRRQRTAAKQ